MKKVLIFRWLIKGFLALLPALGTIWVVLKVLGAFETIVGKPLKAEFGEKFYCPGMGVAVGLAIIIIIGYLLEKWRFFRWAFSLVGKLLERIPGVKSIYNAIQNSVKFFDASEKGEFNRVVKIHYKDGTSELGLLIRESLSGLPDGIADPGKEEVVVLIPWSFQIGGRIRIVPKDMLTPVDISPKEAVKLIFTAFVSP